MASDVDTFVAQREGDFWINALIGAVLAVVLSFIPLSPVFGGGVAGYLQGGTRSDGAKVGGVSGLVAAVPVFAVLSLVFGGLGLGVLVEGSAAGMAFFVTIMLVGLLVTAVLAGGMGALGGYLGTMIRENGDDTDEYGRRPAEPAADATAEAPNVQAEAEPVQ